MLGPVEIVVIAAAIAGSLAWGIVKAAAGPEEVEGWASRYGVTLDEKTRPMVADYLVRSRRYRLKGALIGLVVPFGIEVPGVEMAAGYLVGTLLAEFSHQRLVTEETRAASLTPRTLDDYVPSYVPRLLHGISAAAGALLLLYLWGPKVQGLTTNEAGVVLGGIAAAVLPLIIKNLLERMVERPQPAVSEELVAADDAMRASSMHAVSGAGLSGSLLLLGTLAFTVGVTSAVGLFQWVLPVAGSALWVGALVVWLKLGIRPSWRVRRRPRSAGARP